MQRSKARGTFRSLVEETVRPPLPATRVLRLIPRRLTASLRPQPSFLIIGAQKAGTTSLYSYLSQHPSIRSALVKEINYFDIYYDQDPSWYRAHFPLSISPKNDIMTGEASTYYFFHPLVPRRVRRDLGPQVRLIVLLRDPVYRTYSHYRHEVRKGRETLSFVEALEAEEERLGGEAVRLKSEPHGYSENHRRYAYVGRSRYAGQLSRWLDYFPSENFLVLKSEELFHQPEPAIRSAERFLGLEAYSDYQFSVHNKGDYEELPQAALERLKPLRDEQEQKVNELVQSEFSWA